MKRLRSLLGFYREGRAVIEKATGAVRFVSILLLYLKVALASAAAFFIVATLWALWSWLT